MDSIVWICVCFVCFALGIGFTFALVVLSERRARSLRTQEANAKGRQVQKDDSDELMELMGELTLSFKTSQAAGIGLQEFTTKEAPKILLNHPRIAFKYAKQLMKMMNDLDTGN